MAILLCKLQNHFQTDLEMQRAPNKGDLKSAHPLADQSEHAVLCSVPYMVCLAWHLKHPGLCNQGAVNHQGAISLCDL